ncbi:non-hydrolyzing UDP-N-acetylglucosamine 2-epimerase [Methanothermococcus okinawensis]|uniref:UDP-N-acetylglucosamine 2-epimerase n=1 Tax=Methanothermococcus okinawensis (strain DSM 14208 / JCM 11175 / IH1) TaxID=647113 RepID=F8AN69_METOI|nr:UDP-N-acetylglucosamine 2-epimerase (non-hydrolyzing) [Methanothermococcus okinawensis]AEH06985.1 UDP-N-acetylglucosamine 2-epimerase [Methanothermococcus okinawensis IH1]
MKIGVILGTRPEIIKLSSIIRELERLKNYKELNSIYKDIGSINYFIIHTNQHYSENMDKIFFKELNLPIPNYNLNVGSGSHGKQTAKMLEGIEEVLIKEKPDVVIVQGDTNTVLAGALAASKLKIKVAHVEAGLRSFDKNMPEEINRVLTDHLSDYLFAPTDIAKENLLNEGIKEKIFVVGNTIVDATLQNIGIAERREDIKKFVKLLSNGDEYFLLTLHRAENTDNRERLKSIVEAIVEISTKYDKNKIIFPIHPRTKKRLKEYNLFDKLKNENIKIIKPVGYLEFLMLEKNAKLILTDSGGVQEEACILKVPCITLRDNTERPETINVGCNILVGANKEKIINGIESMLKNAGNWENPFGDGKTGKTIVKILVNQI